MQILNGLLISVVIIASPLTYAASFDCAKARSSTEKLICSDSKLSVMDEQLNTAFKDAISRSNAKPLLITWQRDWLKSYELTQCKDVSCLSTEFGKRIELLNNVASSSNSAAKWNGSYDRHYKGKPDKDSASLHLIGMSGNKIYVMGNALWIGPNAANGQVHTGEMNGVGELKSGKAVFNLDGCSATMAIKDGGLQVEDESGCGGLNVSFVGDYRRR